jgi:hypothetical protein
MRKLASALLIVFLLSASAAWADSIKGGPTSPTTTPTGTGGSTAPVTPGGARNAQPMSALYLNGKQWDVETPPLASPPQGYHAAGTFTLTDANKQLLQQYAGKPVELSMNNNKVVIKQPDGKLDVSVGTATFTGWNAPDKFAYDPSTGKTMYDGKVVNEISQNGAAYTLTFEGGGSVQSIATGGMIQTEPGKVTVYDASGKAAGTFTEKQWAVWTDKFSAANLGQSDLVAAAYIVRDLNLNPDKVQTSPEGTRFFTNSVEVSFADGKATITQGHIDPTTGATLPNTAYTQKTFTVVNGQQVVSHYQETDDKGKTVSEYTYGADSWTVSTRDAQGNLKPTTVPLITYGTTAYPLIGEVNNVKVVMDPQTRAIHYFGADDKELTGAALDKFLADKTNGDAVDKLKGSDVATAAKDGIDKNRLVSCPASQCGQFNSFGQFLNTFTQYFNNYAGLAGWSSLIFDSKFLADWQKQVNHIMCDQLHLPTQACWTSQICGRYVKIDTPRDGVLITSSPGGAIQAVAHIEGQKSLPANTPNATYYAYTVTFGLSNPTDSTMNYNVRFIAKDNSATWWPAAQSLGKGGMVSAIGAQALNKISSRDYGTVCLEFNPSITSFGGASVGKICNDFAQYKGQATAPYSTGNQTTTSASTSTPAPSGGAAPVTPGASI